MNFLKNLFQRKSSAPAIEEKSCNDYSNPYESECNNFLTPYHFGVEYGAHIIRHREAWNYYQTVSPVFDSVDRITRAFNTIVPAVYDSQENIYYTESDSSIPATQLLDKLKTPNREKTWNDMVKSLIPSYQVTGDIFIMVTAVNENREPLEWYFINPIDMSPLIGADNFVGSWMLHSYAMRETFYYQEDIRSGISSYFSRDGSKELWHIKTFNPRESRGDAFGLSPLNSIFMEIEQYKYSNVHNTALLKNGATPSGVMIIDPTINLSDAQYQRLRDQLDKCWQGAGNAGKVHIMEGGKDFKQMSMSNKDMDFLNLLKFVREQIYVTKGIPLPMINSNSMTMNNFEEAKYMMFDVEVLPFADMFYDELNRLFMRRYDDSGRYVLTYNPATVPALQVKISDTNKRKIDSNTLTINESRQLLGEDEIEGGDVLLINTTQVPLGSTGVELDQTADMKSDSQKRIDKYREAFQSMINDNGERKYSDEEIEKRIEQVYGTK